MEGITLVLGDITEQEVEALVNAANSSLMGGGGVDGAIHRKGGPSILDECRRVRRELFPDGLPAGEAVATTAGNLPAKWVIHTVGPVHSPSDDRSPVLRSAHVRSLEVARDLGAETIAFPAISTGAYGYPLEEAAPIAIAAALDCRAFMREIRFVLFSEQALGAYETAARSMGITP